MDQWEAKVEVCVPGRGDKPAAICNAHGLEGWEPWAIQNNLIFFKRRLPALLSPNNNEEK